jgi:hypothetical protein
MAETVEAEVIPPSSSSVRPQRNVNAGFMQRPGFTMFTTGMLAGLLLGFAAVYVIKKKL